MNVKQVIVIRRDLKMRRGKECSQSAHSSMMWLSERFYDFIRHPIRSAIKLIWGWLQGCNLLFSNEEMEWMTGSFTKVTLQVDSEEALLEVYNAAQAKGLTVHLVTDSGKTEFDGVPTRTCCAIGPHEADKIDEITKNLKLY